MFQPHVSVGCPDRGSLRLPRTQTKRRLNLTVSPEASVLYTQGPLAGGANITVGGHGGMIRITHAGITQHAPVELDTVASAPLAYEHVAHNQQLYPKIPPD